MCAPNQAPPQTDPGVNPNTSGAPVIQPKQPSNIGQKTVGVGSAAAGGGLALGAHLMPELAPVLGPAAIIAPLIGGLVSAFMGGKPKTPIQTPATPTFNGTPGVQAPTLQVAQGPSIGSSLVSSGGSAVGSLAANQLQKNQMSKIPHQPVNVDLPERHVAHHLHAEHDHARGPEEDDVEPGHQQRRRIKRAQIRAYRPATRASKTATARS